MENRTAIVKLTPSDIERIIYEYYKDKGKPVTSVQFNTEIQSEERGGGSTAIFKGVEIGFIIEV